MMKHITLLLTLAFAWSLTSVAHAKPKIGAQLSTLELSGDLGGRVDGKSWSSAELKGDVYVMFYVDPDEKDINEHVEKAMGEANFADDAYKTVAVINMDATWLPNAAIASSLKGKQEEYPRTIYVKDMEKSLVKKWKFGDDTYAIAVFDREGLLRYYNDGKFSKDATKEFIAKLRELTAKPETMKAPAEQPAKKDG